MYGRRLLLSLSGASLLAAFACGCGGSSSPPVSVSLAPASAQTDEGQTVGITATLTNSSQGVTWSLSGPGSLSGQTPTAATYNAPEPVAGFTSATATVTATSVSDNTKTASVQIAVNPIPQITASQTLTVGTVGTPYNQTIALTGGTAPFQWSVYDGPIPTGFEVGGAVPDGLQLDAATGTVSGTPTGGGTWYFEATVTDAAGATAFDGFLSIQINPNGRAGNPVPFLNQLFAPTAAVPGSAGFTLNVSGAGFVSGATIDFNGVPLTTAFADSDHLSAIVPAADVASAGTASVTVVNPAPGGGSSNFVYFPVAAPETAVNFVNAANSPLQILEASAIAVGDFNEDGKPDLAVSDATAVSVLLGNGDGTFASVPTFMRLPSPPYDDFPSPYAGVIATGDFNHSGHLGLAVALLQNIAAAILLGNGDGTFNPSTTLANTQGEPTNSLTAGDFNGDGNLDLLAVNEFTGVTPTVLLGYSHGAFNPVNENVEVAGVAAAAGDFNGDGKLDLAIVNTSVTGTPGAVTILLGNGDGTFTQTPSSPITVGNQPSAIVAADFNGDGKLDLAITNATDNTVTILLGNGDGTFTPAPGSPFSVGTQPEAIAVGDILGNGKLDLVVANYGSNNVTLLLGNGDGTFTQAENSPFAVGQGPSSIVLADFNGSGRLGLAVANSGGAGTVSILLQQ